MDRRGSNQCIEVAGSDTGQKEGANKKDRGNSERTRGGYE